jgi:hypothetical protein
LLSNRDVLWQNSSIDFEELFSCWFVKIKHLHSWNLKTFFKNRIYNLTGMTSGNCMRLDHSAGAVVKESWCSDFRSKKQTWFSGTWLSILCCMNCVSNIACSKFSSNLFSYSLPLLNSILGYQLNSSAYIWLQKLGGLLILLARYLKEALGSGGSELAHLQLGDGETILIDEVDYLTSMDVDIGFNQTKSRFLVGCKMVASESVTIVNKL